MTDDVPTVTHATVGDRILVSETGSIGCVALEHEHIPALIQRLQEANAEPLETDLDEDWTRPMDALLDELCWSVASTAERFYPARETAQACVDALTENIETTEHEDEVLLSKEIGQHSRAVNEAVEFFAKLHTYGFDPVGRAERKCERMVASEDLDEDALEIDWTWLVDSHAVIDPPEGWNR